MDFNGKVNYKVSEFALYLQLYVGVILNDDNTFDFQLPILYYHLMLIHCAYNGYEIQKLLWIPLIVVFFVISWLLPGVFLPITPIMFGFVFTDNA